MARLTKHLLTITRVSIIALVMSHCSGSVLQPAVWSHAKARATTFYENLRLAYQIVVVLNNDSEEPAQQEPDNGTSVAKASQVDCKQGC